MSCIIRLANQTDVPAILVIYNHAIINTTAVYQPQTYKERLAWYEQKLAAGYPVIVAIADEQVVGFATYGPFRPWPAYKYTVEHSVYVHPEHQHQGIGSLLLKEIIRLAGEKEYKTLIAGIDSANPHSISLHKKNGFQQVGTIKNAGYKFDSWLDLVFYQLELPGPRKPTTKPLLFVVQQHHAMHMHWDFRLEMDGVLVSWAIPEGPCTDPRIERLTFRVEDHVYGYKDFEGIIPGSDYGSGKVIIWDQGEYEPQNVAVVGQLHETWLAAGKLEFTLYGDKLKGSWILTRTPEKLYGEETWFLSKKPDQYAGSGEIVQDRPQSVVSGKTVAEVSEQDGIFNLNDY